MADDHRSMWQDLGLDIQAHDALLGVLGQAYGDIYMAQKNRPEGMKYFDFVMSEVHGLRVKEIREAQAQGRKVIGAFCVFVPEELVLAVDGILVGLCTGADFATDEAEKYLPRNTCSLIKSAFGFKLGKVCPYIETADLIVGENTCDGKKKSYEILGDLTGKLYVMDLPQTKSANGRELIKTEYRNFMNKLEMMSGKKITVESLQRAIDIVNNKRSAVYRLNMLRRHVPSPISGLDALLINQIFFYDDPLRFTESVNKICDELEQRIANDESTFDRNTPRVLLSGCPMAVPNWKVPFIVETSGAAIVGEESCVGERGTRNLADSNGDTLEQLLDNIVDRYFKVDCAIFTPNNDRFQHITEMAVDYKVDGVIHYCLQFCQPYQIEAGQVERQLENRSIPTLRLDTDYSQEDIGQIKTRIEAFIERINGKK
jgi:benzoyl-CoA reductase/2-hydroxyglutaryl-CoA dehydratase subunit BcrC/BadD/HgdB